MDENINCTGNNNLVPQGTTENLNNTSLRKKLVLLIG